jgi:hypothetical protein
MTHRKVKYDTFLFILTLTLWVVFLGWVSQGAASSSTISSVSLKREDPEFWIKKIPDPRRLLLTTEEIQKLNEENLKRKDLYLCNVKSLKEEWTREEIQALLKEDLEGFGRTEEIRYGRYGNPLEEAFWSALIKNMNTESLKDKNRILFGLIVRRTDIRVFPTDEPSLSTPDRSEFDRFQHSAIPPGSLIGIYHLSKDKLWAYAQTGFIRGWIRMTDLAIAKERREAIDFEEAKDRLVITGNFIPVFADLSFQQTALVAQMGSSFPFYSTPENSEKKGPYYVIQIPLREIDGQLTFQKAYIPKKEDVHRGFLPYHQENVARQAFKMLHQPYGWGEMFGARDCSRFIMDIFHTFGILMPRNSKLQARIGIPLGQVEGKTLKEKKKVLDRAIPMATLLRIPGHIMLYLGKDKGTFYIIHNIWGIQRRGWFGPKLEKIGQVVVSDLRLGETGPNASLLYRLTDIQLIGSDNR